MGAKGYGERGVCAWACAEVENVCVCGAFIQGENYGLGFLAGGGLP